MTAPVWSTACPDWADRLVARQSIIPAPIYPDPAEQALDNLQHLWAFDNLSKGARVAEPT